MHSLANYLSSIIALPLLMIGQTGRFRGGRISKRDRWFGLETAEGFSDFKDWWHREGKDAAGGSDLQSRDEARRMYSEWVASGSPKVE